MRELSSEEIRSSFLNCPKGEAKRMHFPPTMPLLDWEDMDFLGWTDPKAPNRAYLVLDAGEDPLGIALRLPATNRKTDFFKTMTCSFCVTSHPVGGVRMFSAPKPGKAGKRGDTVGLYLCADLACPLYVRGKRESPLIQTVEALTREERIQRLRINVDRFATSFLSHGS
ncbi:FBP domain-containing protein [Nocardiopsis ganjiahuensis]|uniref:FBP domain-containing protein n=1 Tax=Nocardiopsis ganjiahuensis TaxID=239984 RepID=UPI0003463833|nr:FBP domain-containing protein [Nocardiopsis ganjiahuensis]